MHRCLLLFALLFVVFTTTVRAITCTVDATGLIAADFTDLQAAVNTCRAAGDLNVTLQLNGVFSVGYQGLTFPTDILNLTFTSYNGTPANATIQGSCYGVDLLSPTPSLNFVNITFDMDSTDNPLFCPQLTNQNLTIVGSQFVNVSAQPVVPCLNSTQIVSCLYVVDAPLGWPGLQGGVGVTPPNWPVTLDPFASEPPWLFYYAYNLSVPVNESIDYSATEALTGVNGTLEPICPPLNVLYGPQVTSICSANVEQYNTSGVNPTLTLEETMMSQELALNYTDLTNETFSFLGLDTDTLPENTTCEFNYTLQIAVYPPSTVCIIEPTYYLISQEACIDGVYFTLVNNTFEGIPNGAWDIMGVAGFNLQQNLFPSSGDYIANNTAMARVRMSDVATGISYFSQNDHWRCFECREVRCRYAIFTNTYEFRCNEGTLQCMDRQTMDELAVTSPGFCPVGNYEIFDELTNQTISITNDYDPSCTRYIQCPCNTVTFTNVTSGGVLQLPVGNIVLKSGEVLPCVPAPGTSYILMPSDLTFVGVSEPVIGDAFAVPPIGIPVGMAQTMTHLSNGSYILFSDGIIVNPNTDLDTCSCTGAGVISTRNDITMPCEYDILTTDTSASQVSTLASSLQVGPPPTLTESNGTTMSVPFDLETWVPSFCQEGLAYCCEPPGLVDVIYKTDCSLSPSQCAPAVFPNGTVVDPFVPKYYDCRYLANCSYIEGGLESCTEFRCGLRNCTNCVEYPTSDMCWTALNLGSSATRVTMQLTGTPGSGVSLTIDGSSTISGATLSSIAGESTIANVYVLVQSYLITQSTGALSVCTLVGGTLDSLQLNNFVLSNGSVISSLTIAAGGIVTSPAGLASLTLSGSANVVTGSLSAPYPQCNDFLQPTTDPMCLFTREGCAAYYDGNYPITPGYVLYYETAPDNTTVVLSEACSFDPDMCLYFNDSRCACFDCQLSSCELGVEYPATDSCFELLDLGTSDQFVTMSFAGSTLLQMTVDIIARVVDVDLIGGTDDFGNIENIVQLDYSIFSFLGSFTLYTLLNGFLADATVLNASYANGTLVNITVVGGVVMSPADASETTFFGGTIVTGLIQAPYALCNDLSQPATDPLCTFLRDDCSSLYYNQTTGELLAPYQMPDVCPLVGPPIRGWPLNESLFLNVTPPVCEFSTAQCLAYALERPYPVYVDDRCDCAEVTTLCVNATNGGCDQPTAPGGFVNISAVLDAIITSDVSYLPPSKQPRVVLERLVSPDNLYCSTALWYGCDCPPYYSYGDLISVCTGADTDELNCTTETITVQQCLDGVVVNCTLPPVPTNYSFYLNQIPLSCASAEDAVYCDCGAYLASQLCPPPLGSVTYELDNIPDAVQLEITDNSACYHYNALKFKQVSVDVINSLTIAPQPWYDMYSVLRNTQAQDNEFLLGTNGDIVQNDLGTPYRRECSGGCYSDYRAPPTADQYECIVDASTDTSLPGYGVNYFSSVFQAAASIYVNHTCMQNKTVLINYDERYYVEPEDFPGDSINWGSSDDVLMTFWDQCNDFVFASLDGAVIVGSWFYIMTGIRNITFVGLTFVHGGDNSAPMFSHSGHGSIGLVTFYDCTFDGTGARSAGVWDSARIDNLDIRYSLFVNWNYFALRILNAQRVTLVGNTFVSCTGDCLQVRVSVFYRFELNTFIDCRGGSGLRGASTVLLRAGNDAACTDALLAGSEANSKMNYTDYFSLDIENAFGDFVTTTGTPPGVYNPNLDGSGLAMPLPFSMLSTTSDWTRVIPAYRSYECSIYQNVHFTDPTQADYSDTFITASGGSLQVYDVYDNKDIKRQYGMQFLFTKIGTSQDQDLLARLNPGMRPHLFRTVDYQNDVYPGYDFRGWGYSSGRDGVFVFLYQSSSFQCNWPCNGTLLSMIERNPSTLQCRVNNNYDVEVMPMYDDFAQVPHYGYNQWHNSSDAVLFCEDGNLVDGLPMPFVYVTTLNGSRFYLENNITMDSDVWIIGDTTTDAGTWCTIDKGYLPCARGNGNTCQTGRCRMSNMCWEIDQSTLGLNLWQSGDPIPYEWQINNCVFDGRNVPPHSSIYVIQASLGQVAPVDLNQDPLNTALPGPSNATFLIYNSTVQNWTSLPNLAELVDYPFTSGLQVTFVNTLNTNTTFVAVNVTFYNLDRTAIEVLRAINITITDCNGFNVSGLSTGNVAAFYVDANPYYSSQFGVSQLDIEGAVNGTYPNAMVIIDRNYFDQNKTVLTPNDARKANLVKLVTYWIRNLSPNTTFCFRNNTARVWNQTVYNATTGANQTVFYGLPIGARFSDFPQDLLATCLTPPNQVYFPDELRFLRAIADERQCYDPPTDPLLKLPGVVPPPPLPPNLYGIKGTFQDIEESFTDAHLELYNGVLYCNSCCLPVPPPVCYIEPPGVDPLFISTHPWWNKYIFVDINLCLNQCNATAARTCQLLGQSDPLGAFVFYGEPVPFKLYTQPIDLTIGPNVNVNQSNVVTLRGEPGLSVCAPSSHMINNPAANFTVLVEGVTFSHCAPAASPTWDWTSGLDVTARITLNGNIFNGNNSQARPIDGVFDTPFTFTGNYLTNYTGDFGARFTGRNCTQSVPLVYTLNTLTNFPGVNLQLVGFDNLVFGNGLPKGNNVYNNGFFNAGGSSTVPATQRYVVFINTCNDAQPGTVQIAGNVIEGTVGTSCVPPLWSAYYIDPMPWHYESPYTTLVPSDTKKFALKLNFADENMCIAMRINNVPFKCDSPDQQGFLREDIWYNGPNNGLEGQAPPLGFGLYIGPYDAPSETGALLAPFDLLYKCHHCEDGCNRATWDLLGWILGGTLLALLTICCCCFFLCPGGCFLCPTAPTSWHEDAELGQMVPDDRSTWLTFIRYAPSWNGGRPWRPEEGAGGGVGGGTELLASRPVRSLDEASIHNPYSGWGGALREGTTHGSV